LASLWEHLMCHCLRIRCSSLTELRYGNMTNSSRISVYVKCRIDFLLAINVQSEIIGKK